MKIIKLLFILLLASKAHGQNRGTLKGTVQDEKGLGLENVELLIVETEQFTSSNSNGNFQFESLPYGNYTLRVFAASYVNRVHEIMFDASFGPMSISLSPLQSKIKTVEVQAQKDNDFGIGRLKPVEGTAIYAGKKSEVVEVEDLAINKASNNSRQLYSKVAGLNIWESDAAGIQLGIGGRGLNPSRVSNFNTRQNGYDISADALGYPESYYSPSAEAIDRIEIVRGAASLQYGTQFGGFVNFKMKEGPADSIPFELVSRQSVGSYRLFNSFNSIGGRHKKLKFYAFFQHKEGDSWRPNSSFNVNNAHLHLQYEINSKMRLHAEYTFMHYLAQQAGGLTDRMFQENPQQSVRERNWFQVDWNLAALRYQYKINTHTEFDSRLFGLMAGRDAVGNLGQITRTDQVGTDRDLLKDDYLNWGIENRILHRYSLFDNTSIFLLGMRYYSGFTERKQGLGTAQKGPDFKLQDESRPESSFYDFPSQNWAFFSENVFYIGSKFTITPGLRFEYIQTESEGYYINRSTNLAGQIINEEEIQDNRSSTRSFVLAGLGLSYKLNEGLESYANFSQNYRSINFNDMRIVNANYEVDPELQDERGFSADFGLRGNKSGWFNYDLSVFLLQYQDRIGEIRIVDPVLFRPLRFRTNVSDSRTYGLESFAEISFLPLFGVKSHSQINAFVNFSLMESAYINSEESAIAGNRVELTPENIFKTGFSYAYKKFKVSFLYSYTSEQYTDATNAEFTSNAVDGLIPEYAVMDLSLNYSYRHFLLETGINNLTDNRYFTRRASGYPGPGIIPADPKTYYLMLGIRL